MLIGGTGGAQVVYESDRTCSIYDFLDELANLRWISINSAVKPYSRIFIAEKLLEARRNAEHLNKRQKDELDFYLQDYKLELSDTLEIEKRIPLLKDQKNLGFRYSPIGFTYQKFPLTFTLRPVFGVQYYFNENGSVSCFTGGGSFFGYIGKHIGIYAGVTSRYQSQPLVKPEYFTEMDGYEWKTGSREEVTNTEFTGGLTISWKWGDFGVYNDRMEWGTNYHGSNIISGRAPSFPFIKLHLHPAKWLEFSYIHGSLRSNVIDSNRSSFGENNYKIYYFHKYIAANLVTIIPWKGINLSLGNSIVYENDYPSIAFLIPVLFYNSVDATVSNYHNFVGGNSQMFIEASINRIKHFHLYGDVFIDEISITNILNPKKQSNLISYKLGLHLSDLPVRNLSLTFEWTQIHPLVYKHFMPITSYSSYEYCFGHFLRDNSQDVFIELAYKPLKGFSVEFYYDLQQHGKEYAYTGANQGFPFLTGISWKETQFCFRAGYQFINISGIFIEYLKSNQSGDIEYSPALFHGSTNTIIAGLNFGF